MALTLSQDHIAPIPLFGKVDPESSNGLEQHVSIYPHERSLFRDIQGRQ